MDIETTGGHAAANGITEIAIIIHDGVQIIDRYETLVNPFQPIPPYVQTLTGITDAMVQKAPSFKEIGEKVYQLLKNRVFIAHNVNFDYSFVKHHLNEHGYHWQEQKLCTIRMARKVFPDQLSYSLGNLCRSLEIPMNNRHRAGGDAEATTLLWEKILASTNESFLAEYLRRGSGEQSAPIYLDTNDIQELPSIPGVYYFLNGKEEVVYVGKAINLRKRVNSHFTNNKPGKQKQDFLREIHKVKFVPVPNELMAFLLEETEIKRLWPRFNRSQKRVNQKLGLFAYEDKLGYLRLAIEKVVGGRKPLYSFDLLMEGRELLQRLVKEHRICPRLVSLARSEDLCRSNPACACHEHSTLYNEKVQLAINQLGISLRSFVIMEPVPEAYPYARKWNPPAHKQKSVGLFQEVIPVEHPDKPVKKVFGRTNLSSCILIENGCFYGMGYVPNTVELNRENIKQYLIRYPDNDYLRRMVQKHATLFPERVVAV